MTKINDGLRGLDEVPVPDVWTRARDRGPQPPYEPEPPLGRRLGTIALALAVAVVAFAFALSRLSEDRETSVGGTPTITRYRFDAPPQPLAVGEGAAWVKLGAGREDRGQLWRIDTASGAQQQVETPGGDWPAVGGGSAWLLCNSDECGGGAVVQLDAASGEIVRTVDLPGRGAQITGTPEGVWVTTDAGLSFVTSDGRLLSSFHGKNYDLVGTDGTVVWVSHDGGFSRIDPETGERLVTVSTFPDVCTMEVGGGTVWVASCDGGMHAGTSTDELMGVDAISGDVLFRRPIESYGQMRVADGVLWLAENPGDGPTLRLVAFDPRSGHPLDRTIEVPREDASGFDGFMRSFGSPHVFFAVGEGALWVTDFAAGEVIRVMPSGPPVVEGPTEGPPEPTPTLLVSADGPSGDLALLTGPLAVRNGCVGVDVGDAFTYLIWPAGSSLVEDGGLTVVDGSGAAIASIGDTIRMGGGVDFLGSAEGVVDGGIPPACAEDGEHYWYVGQIEQVKGDGPTGVGGTHQSTSQSCDPDLGYVWRTRMAPWLTSILVSVGSPDGQPLAVEDMSDTGSALRITDVHDDVILYVHASVPDLEHDPRPSMVKVGSSGDYELYTSGEGLVRQFGAFAPTTWLTLGAYADTSAAASRWESDTDVRSWLERAIAEITTNPIPTC